MLYFSRFLAVARKSIGISEVKVCKSIGARKSIGISVVNICKSIDPKTMKNSKNI